MRTPRAFLILAILAGISTLPAAAQLFPGVTIVNDPLNKVVLLQQLTQLEQELQIAQANIKNTAGGWGGSIQSVSQVDSQLSTIGATLKVNNSANVNVSTAVTQLQQIPSEVANLSAAQQLSDAAVGQVQMTAASNRLQSLSVGQLEEQRELMLSNVVQTESYEQQLTLDQTNPAEAHALDGSL